MQSATKISLVTLVVAVAALVLALWPVVVDAPWENNSELKQEILDLQIALSILEAESNRPASESEICKSLSNLMVIAQTGDQGIAPEAALLVIQTGLENGCFVD